MTDCAVRVVDGAFRVVLELLDGLGVAVDGLLVLVLGKVLVAPILDLISERGLVFHVVKLINLLSLITLGYNPVDPR